MPVAAKKVATKKSMEVGTLKVESVGIDTLKLWKDNPRRNEEAAPRLAEIMAVHGQRTPVVAWRKNGVIYKGNTTFKALKLLNAKTINVIFADFKSEAAAIAYGIDDNKSSEFAEWDSEILKGFLKSESINANVKSFSLADRSILEGFGEYQANDIDRSPKNKEHIRISVECLPAEVPLLISFVKDTLQNARVVK